jgi:hypothetical protein
MAILALLFAPGVSQFGDHARSLGSKQEKKCRLRLHPTFEMVPGKVPVQPVLLVQHDPIVAAERLGRSQ